MEQEEGRLVPNKAEVGTSGLGAQRRLFIDISRPHTPDLSWRDKFAEALAATYILPRPELCDAAASNCHITTDNNLVIEKCSRYTRHEKHVVCFFKDF